MPGAFTVAGPRALVPRQTAIPAHRATPTPHGSATDRLAISDSHFKFCQREQCKIRRHPVKTGCTAKSMAMRRMAMSRGQARQERVTFRDRDHHVLVGIITSPEAEKVVVLCHGYTSSKDGFHMEALAERLAGKGLGSLRFDFSGNGESQGDFKYANYFQEVGQMESAVEFLQRDQGKTVIGILGHSKGGTDVLLYASKHDDAALRYVNLCGRCKLQNGIRERFDDATLRRLEQEDCIQLPHPRTRQPYTLTWADMQERMNTDVAAAVRQIEQSAVLTLHGDQDETVPVEDAHEVAKHIAGPHTLKILPGCDHSFTLPEHAETAISEAVAFFAKAK